MTRGLALGRSRPPKNPFSADEVEGIDCGVRCDLTLDVRLHDLVVEPIPLGDRFGCVTADDAVEHLTWAHCNPTAEFLQSGADLIGSVSCTKTPLPQFHGIIES